MPLTKYSGISCFKNSVAYQLKIAGLYKNTSSEINFFITVVVSARNRDSDGALSNSR